MRPAWNSITQHPDALVMCCRMGGPSQTVTVKWIARRCGGDMQRSWNGESPPFRDSVRYDLRREGVFAPCAHRAG